jgi:hypothetical protein
MPTEHFKSWLAKLFYKLSYGPIKARGAILDRKGEPLDEEIVTVI